MKCQTELVRGEENNLRWGRKTFLAVFCFFLIFASAGAFLPSPLKAADTDTEKSGPPPESTFEHVAVEPTEFIYTTLDPYTEKLEVIIKGEGCTNWRNLDQGETGWPSPSHYNWFDQDISAPFQFPKDLDVLNVTSVKVELRVFDIDSPSEIDLVYLNGAKIGTLNGTHDVWVWNSFTPPSSLIVQGENRIDIDVDVEHSVKFWAMTVDWIKVTFIYRKLVSPPQTVGGVWTPISKPELSTPRTNLASLLTWLQYQLPFAYTE